MTKQEAGDRNMTNRETIYFRYKGVIEFMSEYPGMYGLDTKRADLHKELEKFFPGKEENLQYVLHHLPLNFLLRDVVWATEDLEKFKRYLKEER